MSKQSVVGFLKKLAKLPFFKDFVGYVKNLPFIRDFDGYFRFPYVGNGCRGVYADFCQAERAIGKHLPTGYNHVENHIHKLESIGVCDRGDLPILPHLEAVLEECQTVIDLGGSIGVGFYGFRTEITFPKRLRWLVCEVPEAVKFGRKIASEKAVEELTFTSELKDGEGFDIFISCGTLQYIKSSLTEIIDELGTKPRHIFISRVPMYEKGEFYTLQSFLSYHPPHYLCSISPYKIQNRLQFVEDMQELGYDLIEEWRQNRKCIIPFHPTRTVNHYYGFYFRKKRD